MNNTSVPLVNILVLNWNSPNDTISCIKSLEKLNYANYEIVIIDNGSSDDSVDRFQVEFYNHVIIVNKFNLGYGAGNNVGIKYSLKKNADYVWILNNDTIVHPDSLCCLVEHILEDKRIGALGSILYYYDNPDQIQAWGGGRINKYFGLSRCLTVQPHNEFNIDYITGASLFIPTETIRDVGMFDEKYFMYWEDVDLCCRFRRAGWELSVTRGSKVLHKESASLGPRNSQLIRYYNASAVRFFSKNSTISSLPILTGFLMRLFKAIFRRDLGSTTAVLLGFKDGLLDLFLNR